MARKLFKTNFINGHTCNWMKRSHPEHPCHKPHAGELYCLYDKKMGFKLGWGYAVFNVILLHDCMVVRSMYHINKKIVAVTDIKQAMLEMGFIYQNGGRIDYDGSEKVDLGRWQVSFRYDPSLNCTVELNRHYTETIDLHPTVGLLRRFELDYGDILAPYFNGIYQKQSYSRLQYPPFVSKEVQKSIAKIRMVFLKKEPLSQENLFKLMLMVLNLIKDTLHDIRHLVYPRLLDYQHEALKSFEQNPLACFNMKPDFKQLKTLIGVTGIDLKALFKERYNMTVQQFINKAWVNEACQRLLARPNESIESIAMDLGWGSAGGLWTDFKRIMGRSPTDYRQKGK